MLPLGNCRVNNVTKHLSAIKASDLPMALSSWTLERHTGCPGLPRNMG